MIQLFISLLLFSTPGWAFEIKGGDQARRCAETFVPKVLKLFFYKPPNIVVGSYNQLAETLKNAKVDEIDAGLAISGVQALLAEKEDPVNQPIRSYIDWDHINEEHVLLTILEKSNGYPKPWRMQYLRPLQSALVRPKGFQVWRDPSANKLPEVLLLNPHPKVLLQQFMESRDGVAKAPEKKVKSPLKESFESFLWRLQLVEGMARHASFKLIDQWIDANLQRIEQHLLPDCYFQDFIKVINGGIFIHRGYEALIARTTSAEVFAHFIAQNHSDKSIQFLAQSHYKDTWRDILAEDAGVEDSSAENQVLPVRKRLEIDETNFVEKTRAIVQAMQQTIANPEKEN